MFRREECFMCMCVIMSGKKPEEMLMTNGAQTLS